MLKRLIIIFHVGPQNRIDAAFVESPRHTVVFSNAMTFCHIGKSYLLVEYSRENSLGLLFRLDPGLFHSHDDIPFFYYLLHSLLRQLFIEVVIL